MSENKKVVILQRVGNPSQGGGILQPGATVTVPAIWAERWIGAGKAREADAPKSKAQTEDVIIDEKKAKK